MGCFNQTCGLSNLHIRHGDQVVLFVLAQADFDKDGGGGYCYPFELWQPWLLPVFGCYNHYGGIEKVEPGADTLLNFVVSRLAVEDSGKPKADLGGTFWLKQCRDDESNANKSTRRLRSVEGLVNKFLHEDGGKLRFRGHGGGERQLSFVMFHRHIFEKLVAELSNRVPYGQSSTYSELYTALALKHLDDFRRHAILEQQEDIESLTASFKLGRQLRKVEWPLYGAGVAANRFNKALFRLLLLEDTRTNEELAQILLQFSAIEQVMMLMRKLWMPQAGLGSQGEETSLYRTLFHSMEEVIVAGLAENGECDDSNGAEAPWWSSDED